MIAIYSRTRNIFRGPLPTVFRSYASALVSDSSYAKKTHPSVAGRSFLIAFLFTPPARVATVIFQDNDAVGKISIHATRAGGDRFDITAKILRDDFYSRYPCGQRLFWTQMHRMLFSIHATCTGGDKQSLAQFMALNHFYSRHPCG